MRWRIRKSISSCTRRHNALLVAPPVAGHRERVYQVFGRETLDQLIPLAAMQPLERIGLPQPPPWRRAVETTARESVDDGDEVSRTGALVPQDFGEVRLHGFVSKPEIQKLNRNSIFIFVNGRLIRDRLVQHGMIEAYRNILPPTVFPVVLLFIEMPTAEVDVNVHPSKTEVRFRQQTVIHDFVRESVRAALMKARPVPHFLTEIGSQPTATRGLTSPMMSDGHGGGDGLQSAPWRDLSESATVTGFALQPPTVPSTTGRLEFEGGIAVEANAAVSLARAPESAGARGDSSRPRVRTANCARITVSSNSGVPENSAPTRPDSKFFHSRGQRRRPLDR